jgi:Xaa-Pro aminopeptidase
MKERIVKLRKEMQNAHVECFYSENSLDFEYLLGFKASKGILLVTEQEGFFFLDHRYFEKGNHLTTVTVLLDEAEKIKDVITQKIKGKKIAFSGKKFSYLRVKELFDSYFKGKEHDTFFLDLVENCRIIKDDLEIQLIATACAVSKKSLDKLLTQKGTSEFDFSQKYKKNLLDLGAETVAFSPIVAFDKNAACPHHSSETVLNTPKEEILFDVGAKYLSYNGDMTKTLLLDGCCDRLKELYSITRDGYYKIIDLLKIGTPFSALTQAIQDHFKFYHVEHLFLHSLGHGIGLELHEAPFMKNHPTAICPIQENMVFTIEPGLYDPQVGGVRLENTIWMSKDGPISLTNLDF